MTKGELRKARKQAHAEGKPLIGELAVAHTTQSDNRGYGSSFSESARGYRARDRWARRYDDLNGAPESDYDR